MAPAAPKLAAKGLTTPKSATPAHVVKVNPEGVVTAIVAVTGVVDNVDDLIVPGAFTWTLAQRRPKVVDDHEWKNKVGRTLHAEEWLPGDPRLPKQTKDGKPWPKEAGALVASMQYNLRSERGRESFEWVRFYAESNEAEFSIGYRVPAGKSRQRRDGVRVILMVDLFEFSHVLFGAAPLSMALQVKSLHGASAGRVTVPALTGSSDDETTEYDDVDAPDPDKPWDELFGRKRKASVECKTAASVLLEAKAGGWDRNKGNAENLRKWFVAGADGQIPWGSNGDFDACVAVASRHMTPEQAKGYCNLRHKEATSMYPATHAKLEGKDLGRMKGSYQERIAMLEHAANDLFTTLHAPKGGHVAACNVATYAEEAVFTVYCGDEEHSYLVPYSFNDDGGVELGEPERVALSVVAEAAPDEEAGEYDEAAQDALVVEPTARAIASAENLMDVVEVKTADRIRARVRQLRTEAKSADQPEVEDGITITADNLPDDGWAEFRKTEPIQAKKMDEPFTVQTREGVVTGDAGGWLALDSDGYPYPIAADEFDSVYVPVEAPAEPLADEAPAEQLEAETETKDEPDDEQVPVEEAPVEEAPDGPDDEPVIPDEDSDEDPDDEPDEEPDGDPDDDGELVTIDPDEHFRMLDEADAAAADDDEEDAA